MADENNLVAENQLYGHNGPDFVVNNAPNVISDTMDPLQNMCDGQYYTSKAEFRRTTKLHGCVEVGDDKSYLEPPKPWSLSREDRKRDLREVIEKYQSGWNSERIVESFLNRNTFTRQIDE